MYYIHFSRKMFPFSYVITREDLTFLAARIHELTSLCLLVMFSVTGGCFLMSLKMLELRSKKYVSYTFDHTFDRDIRKYSKPHFKGYFA